MVRGTTRGNSQGVWEEDGRWGSGKAPGELGLETGSKIFLEDHTLTVFERAHVVFFERWQTLFIRMREHPELHHLMRSML